MRARRRRVTARLAPAVLLVSAVLVTAGSTTAGATETAPAAKVGLSSHLVWLSQTEINAALDPFVAAGGRWIREDFDWNLVEPAQGRFDWSHTDGLMASAATRGVNVLGILCYSATWAASGPSRSYPPRHAGDYARYAAAVVSRYGPGGTFWTARPDLPARPLTAVELWNEPWGYWAWKPDPNPAAYAALARTAAQAIRSANANVKILLPGDVLQVRTDGQIRNWLTELRAADPTLTSLVDAYSVHPYPSPRTKGPYQDSADGRWDYRRVTMTHDIDPTLPIWITEIGWSTASTSDSVSETIQAQYVSDAVKRATTDWGAFVERVFVYSWDKDSGNTADREGYYGMRHQDGTPKPAWTALTQFWAGSGTGTTDSTTTSPPAPPPAPAPAPAPTSPFTVSSLNLANGQTVSGSIVWEAVPAGASAASVTFVIDGTARWTERVAPYRYNGDNSTLDTRTLGNGTHTLTVQATATDGRTATASITVTVSNKKGRQK